LFAAFKSFSLYIPDGPSVIRRHFLAEFNASMNRRVVKLEELDVVIDEMGTVDYLVGLFTSCRNIKKFTLGMWRMDDADFTRTLRTVLPIFSELEELVFGELNRRNECINEIFDVISSSCPNLRKLGVPNLHMENAENFFRNSNLIIFQCFRV
jgi:hypothetical protein